MAGPMVGPLLERLGLDLVTTYWTPGRPLPRPRAEPAAGGEPPLHHRQGPRGGRRPRHRLGRRRRPLLLHRRHGRVRRRRLHDRAARRVDPREAAGRGHPLRRARLAGGAGPGRAPRRQGAHEPRRPRVLQAPHARRGRRVRRRGLRPLLLRRLLQRRLRHRPGAADPRAALQEGSQALRACWSQFRSKYFISGEINSEVEDTDAKMAEIEEKYADGEVTKLDGHLGRLRGLALQRARRRTRSRCCA